MDGKIDIKVMKFADPEWAHYREDAWEVWTNAQLDRICRSLMIDLSAIRTGPIGGSAAQAALAEEETRQWQAKRT
jgi:hypothetical protein